MDGASSQLCCTQAPAAPAQAGAPPFLAPTAASEQQLGLDSRLNMEPQPQASPHLRAQSPNLRSVGGLCRPPRSPLKC